MIALIERAMAPDPRQRFDSAEEMRAWLHGHRAVAGMQVAAPLRPAARPATRVLDMTPAAASPNTFVPALVPRMPSHRKKLLGALAVLAVLILIP